tara:strand:- start:3040 stop:3654 length:615 start_codon:yes stop_codon:yes gene_type:complete
MEKLKFADYDKEGLDFLANRGRPIPGQSLTNDPDNPYPWESPTEFTNLQSATDALFVELTEPEVYESILNMIQSGESIANVAQIVLYDGFQKGMFNPDLLMLLIEPTMYILMALSEKAGIDDYKIYDDEEEDEFDTNEQLEGMDKIMDMAQEKFTSTMKKGVIPREIEQKIERLEIPERKSLLERNEQPQIEKQPDSLLDEGEK